MLYNIKKLNLYERGGHNQYLKISLEEAPLTSLLSLILEGMKCSWSALETLAMCLWVTIIEVHCTWSLSFPRRWQAPKTDFGFTLSPHLKHWEKGLFFLFARGMYALWTTGHSLQNGWERPKQSLRKLGSNFLMYLEVLAPIWVYCACSRAKEAERGDLWFVGLVTLVLVLHLFLLAFFPLIMGHVLLLFYMRCDFWLNERYCEFCHVKLVNIFVSLYSWTLL